LRVKKILWLVGGLCAAGAGFLAWGVRRSGPVEDLAQRSDEPKADEPLSDELHPEEGMD
jgi:hypothetical protein